MHRTQIKVKQDVKLLVVERKLIIVKGLQRVAVPSLDSKPIKGLCRGYALGSKHQREDQLKNRNVEILIVIDFAFFSLSVIQAPLDDQIVWRKYTLTILSRMKERNLSQGQGCMKRQLPAHHPLESVDRPARAGA